MLPSSNPADTSKPAWCVLPERRETGEGVLPYHFHFQGCVFVLTAFFYLLLIGRITDFILHREEPACLTLNLYLI